MSIGKTARAGDAAIFGRFSRDLAGSAEQMTAPAITEMTATEVGQVAGGIELRARDDSRI